VSVESTHDTLSLPRGVAPAAAPKVDATGMAPKKSANQPSDQQSSEGFGF
jgi:hypothetical protein